MRRTRLRKKIVSILTCLSVFALLIPTISAVHVDEMSQYLMSKGVPADIISKLDSSEKEFLFNNLSAESSFSSFSEQEISVPANVSSTSIMPMAAPPSNKLVITLLTFNESSSGGYARKSFYPTFEWKQATVLQYDAFAFSLGSGWYVETANQQLGVHIINSNGAFVLSRTLLASQHADVMQYGTAYKIPQYCGSASTRYKGGAVFYAQKRSSAADDRLHYDYISNNSGISLNISIPVTPYGSVSVGNLTTAQYNQWNGLISFKI